MHIRAQQQAIIDKLVGTPPERLPPPMALDPPWRGIFCRVRRAGDYGEAYSQIQQATEELEDSLIVAKELIDLLPSGEHFTLVPSLWEMQEEFAPVDWLWPSWIPRGLLTLFGAAPGTGKSLVALDLARRIIQGEPFPDGAPVPCPGSNVLLVDAEGTPALLSQRARAWNIDPRRLFLLPSATRSGGATGSGGGAMESGSDTGSGAKPGGLIDLADAEQQERMRAICRSLQPALVVVDSLAAVSSRGETSLEGARALLGFLAAVAEERQVAMLVIHHLRKRAYTVQGASAPQVAADDLRGSSHLSAAARSVLALSLAGKVLPSPPKPGDTEDPTTAPSPPRLSGPRRFEVVKTNLCRVPKPLALTLEGEEVAVPTLCYAPLVEVPPPPEQTELCARWLLDWLAEAGAAVKPADAVRAAAEAGFSRSTLYRARQMLSGWVVDVGSSTRDPAKIWKLAGPAEPSA